MTIGAAGAASAIAIAASPAVASDSYEVVISNNNYALASQSAALWDTDDDATTCDTAGTGGYTPFYDGTLLNTSDAFDGGMVVTVASTDVEDPNDAATLENNVLSTGAPATAAGLKVNSTARALQTAPAVQYLVKFRNPTKDTITRTVTVSSDVGSDGSTVILKDSSSNGAHSNADRWIVTADNTAAPFGDPVVTHVFRGKNPKVTTDVTNAFATANACTAETYKLRVPGGESRYLLLFMEMHQGKKGAVEDAKVYDSQKTMSGALKGISKSLYSKIVNWNLKK
ncbi:MAG TPA: hypothetical protein VFX15_08065 [Actinomycetes bacterium]|nr:hypothetical protein [Actinomycetes bacterium]